MDPASRSNPRDESEYQRHKQEHEKSLKKAVPIKGFLKSLLPYEKELFESGQLDNITHKGSSSIWLEALCYPAEAGMTTVFRPMGDIEANYLVQNNQLPNTQPYQAIIEGFIGFWYANKYLTGQKWTDTHPTTVVQFFVPISLIQVLEKIQTKVEDGALSMGLGNKAGGGLDLFNEALRDGHSTWRIAKIKRAIKEKAGDKK